MRAEITQPAIQSFFEVGMRCSLFLCECGAVFRGGLNGTGGGSGKFWISVVDVVFGFNARPTQFFGAEWGLARLTDVRWLSTTGAGES